MRLAGVAEVANTAVFAGALRAWPHPAASRASSVAHSVRYRARRIIRCLRTAGFRCHKEKARRIGRASGWPVSRFIDYLDQQSLVITTVASPAVIVKRRGARRVACRCESRRARDLAARGE